MRSIEHGTYISPETLARMVEEGTFLVPTIAIVSDLTIPGATTTTRFSTYGAATCCPASGKWHVGPTRWV